MVVLSPAERTVLQGRLAEARQAYHTIMTGGAVKVVVDQNGERVEYQQGSATRLLAYIAALENQLGIGCPTGPLNIWF